jgi:hypothetical protein
VVYFYSALDTWQPEPWNMLIFDAVVLGVVYLASENDESIIRKLAGR